MIASKSFQNNTKELVICMEKHLEQIIKGNRIQHKITTKIKLYRNVLLKAENSFFRKG